MDDTRTDEELREIVAVGKAAQSVLDNRRNAKAKVIEERIAEVNRGLNGRAFTTDELRFAATARCPCGAGMAYPRDVGVHGAWDCSAILMGKGDRAVTHEARLPFAFYKVRAEDESTDGGGPTTRPVVT